MKGSLLLTGNGNSLRPIAISVVAIHAMLLFICYFQSFKINKTAPRSIPKQKITIQTIELNPSNSSVNIHETKLVTQIGSGINHEISTASITKNIPNQTENNLPPKKPDTTKAKSLPQSPIEKPKPSPKVEKKIIPKKSIPKETPAANVKKSTLPPKTNTNPVKPIDEPKPTTSIKAEKVSTAKATATSQTSKETNLKSVQDNAAKQKLLAQARESLNKVQSSKVTLQSSGTQANTSTAPKMLGKLQSETLAIAGSTFSESRESNYQDELINRLRSQLQLVEYGDVDIQLTLGRMGNVISIKVVKDENRKNRQYIEKTIPTLHFAGFGASFPGETQHTFFIRLRNE